MDASYIPMFVFLLVGACCNLPFFVRSVRDLCRTSAFTAMPAAPSALLTTALAELSWVLPCLVQCALQAFNGDGPWSAARGGVGCDVMGFYSVFGSIAGMSSTLWVAILTNWPGLATARLGYLASVVVVVSAALFAALPWMGVGRFAYTGEGFCYFDFHDTALAAVLLAATLPMLVATLVREGLAEPERHEHRADGDEEVPRAVRHVVPPAQLPPVLVGERHRHVGRRVGR